MLVSAQNSGNAFDLRCAIRESMIAFIARDYPEALPRLRSAIDPVEIGATSDADQGRKLADRPDEIIDGSPRQA